MEHQPVVKKKRGISPVWILPIVAAAICSWLLYKGYTEAGIDIEVDFYDASGIVPGKTQVMAMGLPLGIVKDMEPDLGNHTVKVLITMERSTEDFLVEDLNFWLVKPEVSAHRITGLETILTGSYIGVQKGESTTPARSFTALRQSPPIRSDEPGLHIVLHSKALRSIQEGSPIYFQNISIGKVKDYALQDDESIAINCFIQPEYSHLIRSGSRFFDASGFLVSGTLPNIKVRMESISSLFIGGIVVGTPGPLKDTPPANSGDEFTLYESFDDADYGIPMTLKLASGSGIREGSTKLIYRGIEAGTVKEISINDDERHSVTANILLDPRAEMILRENTKFWLVKPELSLDGVRNLGTLLSGAHITFQPGDGKFKDNFEILDLPPVDLPLRPGKTYFLSSAVKPSSSLGAPIYYKKMQIGELLGSELAPDHNSISTSIYIYDEYTDLITTTAVFVEAGGISINADFSGFSFKVDPLVSTFKGGIDVIIPEHSKKIPAPADAEHQFTLYPDFKAASKDLPSLLPDGLYITLASADLGSYRTGTPVFFKKIKVGHVIGFTYDKDAGEVRLSVFIMNRYRDLVTSASKFYNASGIKVHGGLSGISVETESLESIVAGGIGFFTEPGGSRIKDEHRFSVYKSLLDAQKPDQFEVTVKFENIGRLTTGATVSCRGVQLGEVVKTSFDQDLRTIIATLSIDKQYEPFFRRDTKIWLSKPVVKLSRMENLSSLVFGLSVIVEPGSGKLATDYIGLPRAPHPFFTSFKGLGLVLETNQLGSLDIGSPVYYRRVKVGEVSGYDLAYNFKDVLVYITIEKRYAPLIRENTKFWNASGVRVTGGVFSGVTVATESLEALVAGGIALATPNVEDMGPRVETGFRFKLHQQPEDGWLDWSPEIFVVEEEKQAAKP